jgi:Transposase, Mutator family
MAPRPARSTTWSRPWVWRLASPVRGLPDLRRAGWRGRRVRSRSLAHTGFPYVFVDATYLKARVDGRVVSRAVVIATA